MGPQKYACASSPSGKTQLPIVETVFPAESPREASTLLTITGQGFGSDASVEVGGTPCDSVHLVNVNKLTCQFEAAADTPLAMLDVVVKNPDGRCGVLYQAYNFITPVEISPHSRVLAIENSFTFNASQGKEPYHFVIISGQGTIGAETGEFHAPDSPGTSVVRVADAGGTSAEAVVITNPALSILPDTARVSAGNHFHFSASGGSPPYTYALSSGPGEIDGSSGIYTAAEGGKKAVVEVTDTLGNHAEAKVQVEPELKISPVSSVRAVSNTVDLTVTGGVADYHFSVLSGLGSLSPDSGNQTTYTAAEIPGTAVVRVTDSQGTYRDATFEIEPRLVIHPSSRNVLVGSSLSLIAAGGVPPYKFSVRAGLGQVDPETGLYQAPHRKSDDVVRVMDSVGNFADAVLSVNRGSLFSRRIAGGWGHSCVVIGESLRCWGDNEFGQVGDGTTTSRRRPTLVKGLEHGVMAVVAGFYHSCALLTGGAVKCWGDNRYGQLGNGTQYSSSTPVTPYGLTEGVSSISAGQYHTCVVKGGAVFCWGDNRSGQIGDGTHDQARVPHLVQGMNYGAEEVGAGSYHSCAIQSGRVKCWGFNGSGQLGDGKLRESSVPVEVKGLDGEIQALDAKGSHSCAIVDGMMRCWGWNGPGNLGTGSRLARYVPVPVADIGSDLASISLGYTHTCAVLQGGVSAKCWGNNFHGELGDGSTEQMETKPVPVANLPTGIIGIAAGVEHSCALFDDSVWCWGNNSHGQFGNGSLRASRRPVKVFLLKHYAN